MRESGHPNRPRRLVGHKPAGKEGLTGWKGVHSGAWVYVMGECCGKIRKFCKDEALCGQRAGSSVLSRGLKEA